MSILGAFGIGPREQSGVAPPDTLWLRDHIVNSGTQAGKHVTVEEALTWDAVWACVSLIVNAAKQMPLCVYREYESTGTRQRVRTVPQARLLQRRPTNEHYPSIWKSLVFTHLCAWGNAYLGKEYGPDGNVVNLWPIPPEEIRIGRENGVKAFYRRQLDGSEKRYTSDTIIHIFGFSIDGLNGLSPIGMMREAIGAGLAMDEYLNRFYSNGTVLSGILTTDQELGEEARGRVEKAWKRSRAGVRNFWKIAMLEGGLKYQAMGVPMRDAQFVEAHNLGVQKVARAFNIAPSMVAAAIAGESMTYRNVESDALNLLKYAVAPWLFVFEEALNFDANLFPPHLCTEFESEGVLRADTKTRFDAYSVATGGRPWMLPSEVREKEGMEPDDSVDELPPSVKAPGAPGSPARDPLNPPPAPTPPPGG